jgi:hypothetical protein
MKRLYFGILAAVMLVLTACGASGATEGPVTIEIEADFSARPVVGTFEITEGADVLGCSSGTSVDEWVAEDSVLTTMTCTSGSNSGTFTADFDPDGPWSIVDSSGDFVGLQGSGDFLERDTGSTFTGDIEFAP